MHNGPWYNWNQMTNMYGYQNGQPNSSAGGWGDWNSTGYFPQGGQQSSGFGNYGAGSYDYSQNGGNGGRGQGQNSSAPQRQVYQSQSQY